MSKKLAVAIIHGMGNQKESDYNKRVSKLVSKINKRLSKLGADPNEIAYIPLFWADITQPRQDAYFDRAIRKGNLDYRFIRKFVLSALGDASGYQQVLSSYNTTYQQVHERIDTLLAARNDIGPNTPLVVLAHSLGGHIMSNYIWDKHKAHPADTDFLNMETLAGMVTFGCNIPLFTFAYDQIEPIRFGEALSPDLQHNTRWYNFYDPDDVLGYPLKPINDLYDEIVDADLVVNVGGLFASWNPMSHNYYWHDNDFVKPVSKYLHSFL